MNIEAYKALDAIDRRAEDELADCAPWIDALKTIRWVASTDSGLVLTSAGRAAFNDMRPKFGANQGAA